MHIHLAIVVYNLLKTAGSTGTQFETQSDMMIKPEWYYMEVGSMSLLHCAFICGWDVLCMSASHGESNDTCKLSSYRINGAENQNRLITESSWKTLTKIGYLEGWIMIGETYYLFDYGWRNYNQAIVFCEQNGGKLAEPQTNSTNQLIRNYIAGLDGSDSFWFGLNDIPTEGQFTWASTGDIPSYSGWKTGEPSGGLDDCCAYDPSGSWNDFACHYFASSICELA